MVSTVGSSFPVPSEAQLHILSFSPEVAPTLRLVSAELKKIVDEFLLAHKEEIYRGLPRRAVSPLLQRCIQRLYDRSTAHNPAAFHYSLVNEIRALGVPPEECPCQVLAPEAMDRFDAQIQTAQDESLKAAWGGIRYSLPFSHRERCPASWSGASVQQFRTWIEANGEVFREVSLDMSQPAHMNYVPVEIALFTGLQKLFLGNNRLTSLSEETFHTLVGLRELSLSRNQLAFLPERLFDGLNQLQRLYIGMNRLKSLPEGLFRGLVSLCELNLGNNRLLVLPEGLFRGLGRLQQLHLDQNSLSSLPGGLFSDLVALQSVSLNNNHLSVLPASLFQGPVRLAWLHIHNNPLLVPKRTSWKLDINDIDFARAMEAFFSYRCRSPLAEFYQLTARGAAPEAVRERFSQLPARVKNGIYGQVWIEAGSRHTGDFRWGEHTKHAFDDMQIFYRALKKYVMERFDHLSETDKNALCIQVSELAREEEVYVDRDSLLEELLVCDNFLRTIDAFDGFNS